MGSALLFYLGRKLAHSRFVKHAAKSACSGADAPVASFVVCGEFVVELQGGNGFRDGLSLCQGGNERLIEPGFLRLMVLFLQGSEKVG